MNAYSTTLQQIFKNSDCFQSNDTLKNFTFAILQCVPSCTSTSINILRISWAQRFHLFRSFLDHSSSCRIRRSITPSQPTRYNLIHIYHISKRQKERREKLLRSQITEFKVQFKQNSPRHSIRNESYSMRIKIEILKIKTFFIQRIQLHSMKND